MDATALLQELKAIKTKQSDARRQRFEAIAAKLRAASRSDDSATRIYSEAVRDSEFSANARDTARFQEWRERNKGALSKDKAAGTAARLHLNYLAISLERAANPDGEPPLRALWEYATALKAARMEYGGELTANEVGKRLLQDSIADSPIARANFIVPELQNLKGWEMSAGSLHGVLEKDLRDPLREIKDARLLDTWKLEIDFESKNAESEKSDLNKAAILQVELPRRYWGQARDMIVLGQTNRGIGEMVKLVRAYPSHPDLPAWVDEITQALQPKEKSP